MALDDIDEQRLPLGLELPSLFSLKYFNMDISSLHVVETALSNYWKVVF